MIPGGIGDPSATAYLFKAKGGSAPTGRPSPRGRLAMARAAGVDVRVVTVGKADSLTLDDCGDVDHLELDPDARPAAWGELRGVVIHVDDLHTGARRSLWIARADLAERKAKAGQKSAWDTDAIGMALTKAVAIAITRGAIPQASLIPAILAACAASPTPARPLAIEATTPRQIAEAPPAAPAAPDPEPTGPDPEPEYDIDPDVDPAEGPADVATDPEPAPSYAAEVAALAADAECGLILAEQTITAAVAALRDAGMARAPADLRAPAVWRRLIQRAAELARAIFEAEATKA